jgi:ABC-type branched-subunit amino acid transport system substrate-binding protein
MPMWRRQRRWQCDYSYALTNTLARSVVGRGGDTWFFLTVDYAFGYSLETDATSAVAVGGGKVLGRVRHPLNNADFSSYLLQAQASGAKVAALANAGGDMINATKQASEFGLSQGGQTLVSLLSFITDIHTLGLAAAQGLRFVTGFYWDRDNDTRVWSKRFLDRHGRMPTAAQASVYSAIRHYLRAIEAAGTEADVSTAIRDVCFSGVKRTWLGDFPTSPFYPQRTCGTPPGIAVHNGPPQHRSIGPVRGTTSGMPRIFIARGCVENERR